MPIDFKKLTEDIKNHKENTEMGKTLAPSLPEDRIILEEDAYLMRIDNIEEKQGKIREDDGTERDSVYYRWTFTVVDDRVVDQNVPPLRGNTGESTGPKSKTFAWVSAALGEPWSEPIDWPDDIINKVVKGFVTIKTYKNEFGQDIAYNAIDKLVPAKRLNNGRFPAPAEAVQAGVPSAPPEQLSDALKKKNLITAIGGAVKEIGWTSDEAKKNRYEVVPREVPIKDLSIEELEKVLAAFKDVVKRLDAMAAGGEDVPF